MKALQTDFLIDYLVERPEKKGNTDHYFKSSSQSETYFLNNIVLSEVASYFEDNVKFDKSDTLMALRALISISDIKFEDREIVSKAIETYENSRDSFSECLKRVINTNYQTNSLEVASY